MGQNIGEYADLHLDHEKSSVTFKDRFTAEKFMAEVKAGGGEIGGVGKVELEWINMPLPPISLPAGGVKTQVKLEGGGDDAEAHDDENGDGDAMAEDHDDDDQGEAKAHGNGHEERSQQTRERDLDYDVGDDDNDWR
jgi:hypothetical protein